MKKISILILLFLSQFIYSQSRSDEKVKTYRKKSGTIVYSHKRTNKDNTDRNNYSTKPNYNPYTGKKGTKKPKR